MKLYTYWRSSAAYRVRIALNLKGLQAEHIPVSLLNSEQKASSYTAKNPQGLVPFLEDGPTALSQSLAIIEYLDETHPTPAFLPSSPAERAHIRAFAQIIACDIHPLNNLRILKYLTGELALSEEQKTIWIHHWLTQGFTALEAMVNRAGRFCFGDTPTLADIALIPQIYNARRFQCDLSDYPKLTAIADHCATLPAFLAASPEKQPDAA